MVQLSPELTVADAALRAAMDPEAHGTWRGLRPLKLRLTPPEWSEGYGGGMLKLLRNVIILRAVWRLFKRGRRV